MVIHHHTYHTGMVWYEPHHTGVVVPYHRQIRIGLCRPMTHWRLPRKIMINRRSVHLGRGRPVSFSHHCKRRAFRRSAPSPPYHLDKVTMVFFSCDGCAEVLKKSQVDGHAMRCRRCTSVSCVDCLVSFFGGMYKGCCE